MNGNFPEKEFQKWYAGYAEKLNLNPNPDDPKHYYDYRAAFSAGVKPNPEGHWPSQFKKPEHPNRFVMGIDTITGKTMNDNLSIGYIQSKTRREGQSLEDWAMQRVKSYQQQSPENVPETILPPLQLKGKKEEGKEGDFWKDFKGTSKDLLTGVNQWFSSFVGGLANVSGLIEKAENFIIEKTGTPKESIGPVITQTLQKIAQYYQPTEADLKDRDSFVSSLSRAIGQAPGTIAEYATGAKALKSPVAAFALIDAIKASDKGAVETLLAALRGSTMGLGLKAIQGMDIGKLTQAGLTGGLFGGTAAVEGAGTQETAVSGIVGAGLGAMGAGKKPLVGKKEIEAGKGLKPESTGDLFKEETVKETATLGEIRPEFLRFAEGALKEGQDVFYKGTKGERIPARIETIETVVTPQGNKPQIVNLDVNGKKVRTSANNVELLGTEPPKPPIAEPGKVGEPGFEEWSRGFDEITQDVKTILDIGERGEFSWKKKLTPGKMRVWDHWGNDIVVELKESLAGEKTVSHADFQKILDATKGMTLNAKIADKVFDFGKIGLVEGELRIPKDFELMVEGQEIPITAKQGAEGVSYAGKPEMVQTILQEESRVKYEEKYAGQRGSFSTQPLSEEILKAKTEALNRLKRDAGKLGSTIGDYLTSRGVDKETIQKVLAEIPQEDREKKFGPYKERIVTINEATKAKMDEFLKMADEDQVIEGKPEDYGINFDRINTPEDVKATISKISVLYKDKVKEYRRGTRTHAETEAAAKRLGMTVEQLLARETGEAFNPEESFAARSLAVASAMRLKELSKLYLGTGRPRTVEVDLLKQFGIHAEIQAQVSGVRAEAGRTLNQWAMDATGEIQFINQVGEAFERIGTGMDAKQLAVIINTLKTPSELGRFVEDAQKPGLKGMLIEAWINGLLSNPATHIVNITSNFTTLGIGLTERALASRLHFGTDPGVVKGEAAAMMHGMTTSFIDALKVAGRLLKEGDTRPESLAKVETFHKKAITAENMGIAPDSTWGHAVDFLGNSIRLPGRFLTVADEFFKAIVYRAELNAQSWRQATQEGLEGQPKADRIAQLMNDVPDSMTEAARQMADYLTFTKELGPSGKAIQQFANSHPMAKVILPFTRTPVNIFKFALERTPGLNLLLAEYRDQIAQGGPVRDMALGKMGFGAMVMLTATLAAASGYITGGGPADKKMKERAREKGWQEYSIKIGDTYHRYDRLDPLGMLLGTAADIVSMAQDTSSDEIEAYGWSAIVAFSRNLMSKTYLQGITDFVEFLEKPSENWERYYRRLAGSLVPSGVAALKREVDPTLREVNSIGDQLKSRIPGLSETLPARINFWGEPIVLQGGLGPDILSPIYISKEKPDPVIDEIIKNRVSLSMPPKQLGGTMPSDNPLVPERVTWGVKLSPKQYERFCILSGKESKINGKGLHQTLDDLMGNSSYQNQSDGPDGGKAIMIRSYVHAFRRQAEYDLYKEYPELDQSVKDKRKEKGEARRPRMMPAFQ